jgi:hypothetical protein
MSFALTLAFAFDYAIAAFAAFPSTFAVPAFAFATDAFTFAWGGKSRVFVLAIFNTVRVNERCSCVRSADWCTAWGSVNAVLRHATLVEDLVEFF